MKKLTVACYHLSMFNNRFFIPFIFIFYLFADCPLQANAPLSLNEIDQLQIYVIELVNQERRIYGLKALKSWKVLFQYAKEHSQRMALGKIPMGHQGFELRANAVRKQARIQAFGENIAYCRDYADPARVAVAEWMKSPDHRKNILDDFDATTMSIVCDKQGGFYFTQLFVKF